MRDLMGGFTISVLLDGKSQLLRSEQFTVLSAEANTRIYSFTDRGFDLRVEIAEAIECEERLSHAVLYHSGAGTVKGFQYPIVSVDGLATFDKLLMASAWGDCIPRPSKTLHDISTSTSIRFDQDYIRYEPDELIYTYPSIMAMQYMTLFNDAESLYVATYSTSDETMTFHAKSTGKYSLELSVTHYPFLDGGVWESPKCSVAKLGGGWHPAADLYRSRMQTVFETPEYPEWMMSEYHGWAELTVKQENKPLHYRFSELASVYHDISEKTGMNHLFVAGWHDFGHDTKFPRYLPCEEAGTSEDLRAAVNEIHDLGGRISLYTNARLIDIYDSFYRDGGKNAVSLDENGKPYLEDYHTQSLYAVCCPGCPEYAEHMAGVAERISGEYGADGMFVDQISCNLDPFCYSKEHSHSKPSNNFLPGVEKELTGIQNAARKANPKFHTFAEGCHERFGQFYEVNQGHGEEYTWQVGESIPEQFLYTFPDRIVTGHCMDKQQMYHAMSQFKPLDIKIPCWTDPTNYEPLQKYIALRKAFPEFFFRARFLDDEGFVYDQKVRLHAVRAADGSLAVCLWKPGAQEDTACSAYLKLPEKCSEITVLPYSETQISKDGCFAEIKWVGALTYLKL